MPRFFDDYSNTYLTHDSSAGRKQQRRGWKFRENFRLHYEPYVKQWQRGTMGLAAAQQGFLKMYTPDHPAVPPLPEGWREELDEVTGIVFYVDTVTKRRTWVRPGFIPPPPGAVGPPPSQRPPQAAGAGGPPPPLPPHMNHHRLPPPPPLPPGQVYGGAGGPGGGPPLPPPPLANLPPPPPGQTGLPPPPPRF